MDETSLTLIRVEDESYSLLVHIFDEKGALVDIIPSPVLGFLMNLTGVPVHAVTLRGPCAVKDVALWGPEGCVHRGPDIWPSLDAYMEYAKGRVQ